MAKKKAGCGQMILGCLVFIVGGVALSIYGLKHTVDKIEEHDAAMKKLDQEMPKGTAERLKHDVSNVLGKSNRDTKRSEITTSDGTIRIRIWANDNLTAGFIKGAIKLDIYNCLEAIHDSGYDYNRVDFIVSAPLMDELGNSSETIIVQAEYNKSLIDKINWSNYDHGNVLSIANDSQIHPVLTKD